MPSVRAPRARILCIFDSFIFVVGADVNECATTNGGTIFGCAMYAFLTTDFFLSQAVAT